MKFSLFSCILGQMKYQVCTLSIGSDYFNANYLGIKNFGQKLLKLEKYSSELHKNWQEYLFLHNKQSYDGFSAYLPHKQSYWQISLKFLFFLWNMLIICKWWKLFKWYHRIALHTIYYQNHTQELWYLKYNLSSSGYNEHFNILLILMSLTNLHIICIFNEINKFLKQIYILHCLSFPKMYGLLGFTYFSKDIFRNHYWSSFHCILPDWPP